ncbi:MAG: dockerin type I domain-containing protein [Clostridia bacterium]|nr:dockerin type I domain-containing protein [Clostridia bacterium]
MKKIIKIILSLLIVSVFLSVLLFSSVYAVTSEQKNKEMLISKGFPESYAEELSKIKTKYPNWDFVPAFVKGSLDDEITRQGSYTWAYNVNMGPRLYTRGESPSNLEKNYGVASRIALAYFMDPNSFIASEVNILMFEDQAFDSKTQTVAAVQNVLNGTFMESKDGKIKYEAFDGSIQIIPKSYAQVIWNAGYKSGINPIYLAQKIILEVGRDGSSTVGGAYSPYKSKYPEYRGYYNFFNWGATSHDGMSHVVAGLDFAKKSNWSNPEISIMEGALKTSNGYITKGQNTPYFQKFNINPNTKQYFPHQYMAAIHAPLVETGGTYKAYSENGLLKTNRTFLIPVFKNYGKTDIEKLQFNYSDKNAVVVSPPNIRTNVRTGPSTAYQKLSALNNGKQVKSYYGKRIPKGSSINEQWSNPLWYNIQFDGKTGFIFEDGLNVSKTVKIPLNTSVQLQYTKYPTNASEKPMFMISDSRYANINIQTGLVTGKMLGKTKAVIYSKNGAFDVVNIEIVKNNSSQPNPTITEPTSKVYKISSDLVENVKANTTVAKFKANINGDIIVMKNGKALSDSALITTGSIINAKGSSKKYSVVIKGDMNGDGKISTADAATVMYYYKNKPNLSKANINAGDANNNSVINVTDAAQIMYWISNNK